MRIPESSLIRPEGKVNYGCTLFIKHFESIQVSSALRVNEHAHFSDFSWHIHVDKLWLIVLFTPFCLEHFASNTVGKAELEASDRMVRIVSLVYDLV